MLFKRFFETKWRIWYFNVLNSIVWFRASFFNLSIYRKRFQFYVIIQTTTLHFFIILKFNKYIYACGMCSYKLFLKSINRIFNLCIIAVAFLTRCNERWFCYFPGMVNTDCSFRIESLSKKESPKFIWNLKTSFPKTIILNLSTIIGI